jgi:hypothetical protein
MGFVGRKPTNAPLTSSDLGTGIVGSTNIADGTIANADIANATIALAKLSATGTPSASTFLRGDNAWGEAGAAAGQVIQVLGATDSTQRSTTSTSFVTGSNALSVTITPSSASNKIAIFVHHYSYTSGYTTFYTIYRGATNLGGTNGIARFSSSNGAIDGNSSYNYLDSPSTTSATTYQVYFKTDSGTGYLNVANTLSQIIVMEIKG